MDIEILEVDISNFKLRSERENFFFIEVCRKKRV